MEHESARRMQSTMEAQGIAAADLEFTHDTSLAALQTHANHCFNEEFLVRNTLTRCRNA